MKTFVSGKRKIYTDYSDKPVDYSVIERWSHVTDITDSCPLDSAVHFSVYADKRLLTVGCDAERHDREP